MTFSNRTDYLLSRWRGIASAGVLYVTQDEHILLLRSATTGHWQLPGGGRDGGETLWDCARREVGEELGWELTAPRRVIGVASMLALPSDPPASDDMNVVFGVLVPQISPAVRLSDEHTELRARTLDDWGRSLTPESCDKLSRLVEAMNTRETVYEESTLLCFDPYSPVDDRPSGYGWD